MFYPVLCCTWRNGVVGEMGLSELCTPFVVAEDASGGSGTSIGTGYQYLGWVSAFAIGGGRVCVEPPKSTSLGSSVPWERQG